MRFCVVGIINTLIDTAVFVGLRLLGLTIIYANFVSTSLGVIASYLLNTRYTFQSRHPGNKRIAAYFAVTLFGLWVVQPVVITSLTGLDDLVRYSSFITGFTGHAAAVSNLIPKITAIGVSTIWNYTWYSRIIFK